MTGGTNRLQPPASSSGAGAYASDLTNARTMGRGPGTETPTRKEPKPKPTIDTKRKQTLLSLLDILAELQKEGDSPLTDTLPHSKAVKAEEPTEGVDDQLQKMGAEAFFKFQKRINNLDRELRNFANATRQLGSSVGILSSAFHLRERIVQVLFLFRENAADLFPTRVHKQSVDQLVDQKHRTEESSGATGKRKRNFHNRKLPHIARPTIPTGSKELTVEDFPEQLEAFANDIKSFLKSLNEFPEFTDEVVNNSMDAFEADLKYWASCLKTYSGQFKFPAVQRYVHDLCGEMGDHLETISSSLAMFLEIGIPTIRFAQKHAADNLQNLSTVATFFSAVTATTLQFSFDQVGTQLSDAVNLFWFISLVFSIASAVNSLLGLTWKQAMYRSPGHRVPWWVLIWIKRSPLIFLVFSVAAFSVGLCLFAYSSGQSTWTSGLTTVFTCFSSFGLVAVSAWFIFERWTFSKHLGRKWLMDVLSEAHQEFNRLPPIRWIRVIPHRRLKRLRNMIASSFLRTRDRMINFGSKVSKIIITCMKKKEETPIDDVEKGQFATVPAVNGKSTHPVSPTSPYKNSSSMELMATSGTKTPTSPSPRSPTPGADLTSPSSASLSLAPSETAASTAESGYGVVINQASGQVVSPGRRRFANLVRNVISANKLSPIQHRAARSMSSPSSSGLTAEEREELAASRGGSPGSRGGARVASLIPALKSLQTTQNFQPHSALVRHLQFSPNGEFLATCSWDRTCLIFSVKDFSQPHRVLAHPQGFVGQVAWSPKGDFLLTKMARGMRIWTTESGVCRRTIDRRRPVQSIAWFPQSEAFLSVEGSNVVKLDLNGNVMEIYQFERMVLHDVAITNDQQRMLCVATLTASPDGLKPSMSREEKQIIVYNLDKKEIENQVPILHEVRDITLAKNGTVALVSYENKAPPQLWKLESVKDRTNETNQFTVRLSLERTYMPKAPVDFAGPSYFGGTDDQLVLCAGKAGDIHIWDRRSGYLLHSFQAQDLENDLTCIAWNHASTPFMFSTGCHDGTVRVWETVTYPQLSLRTSFVDMRLSEANTPRSVTPEPPAPFVTTVTLEASESLSVKSIASSRRNSIDGRNRTPTPTPVTNIFTAPPSSSSN